MEKYEILEYSAGLAAVVELGVALKVPVFRAALPFALLPVTPCAGAAVYFHHKLPEGKKCSPFSRRHPMPFFIVLLIGNVILLLLPLIELWRR